MARLTFAAALFCFASIVGAHSQSAPDIYPSKPIRFIVPAAAGGSNDVYARLVTNGLSDALRQPVIVDFKPGASSIIGTSLLAKAPADGYTIGIIQTQSHAINPNIRPNLPYDPVKDFVPITRGVSFGFVLVVHRSVPAKNLNELIALAKAKPNELTYGSAGVGAANHLAGGFLATMADLKLMHVPYKSSGGAITDVLGGHISMMFVPAASFVGMTENNVRAIGYSGINRSRQLPDLPTLAELGLTGFDVTAWQGIAAPSGTPKPIIDRLQSELMKIFKSPDVIDRLVTKTGNELADDTPEEFAEFIKSQIALYGAVVKKANIRSED